MKYYSILLPIQTGLSEIFYSSEIPIPLGARVIVPFNRRIVTGICHQEAAAAALDSKIKYKPVIEILDQGSIFPPVLFELSAWMSRYYRCSLGKAVFAMLPSVLLPEIATQLKWIGPAETGHEFKLLHQALSDLQFHPVQSVRDTYKAHKSIPFYKTLETAEANGLIEVKRGFDSRIKPKIVNYVVPMPFDESTALTPKQAFAWQIISARSSEFPLHEITEEVSYAVIKALAAKGMIHLEPRPVEQQTIIFPEHRTRKEISLTHEQRDIIDSIIKRSCQPSVHLIYGITGSGKTEVYIEVIRHYLDQELNTILLIPEISLTPQMVDRFYSVFGSLIAILHSQLTERQRYEQWQEIRNGKCRIVIGARSAIFAPLDKVGLIIVDEEHEPSYKQENNPRYQARDLAIVRARLEQANVILGSATPALESWHNARQGKYACHRLLSRPTPQGLPAVQLLDLRDEQEPELLSLTLRNAIQQSLEQREQVILLQNRRGYASFIQCHNCGILQKCPHCEISLYYHHDREEMVCHYCGHHIAVPRKCPACGHYSFSYGAPGTQKIEQLLKTYFPSARVLRLDSDSSRRKDSYTYMYDKMHKNEIDILLGTQMVSKGLDFPNVTLAGVVLADISLNVPDFRAAERTFNLLTQVAGRSGRGERPGKVIVQTWNPDHYAIRFACAQDYVSFAEEELEYRKRLFYPPFYRLARLLFTDTDENRMKQVLNKYHSALDRLRQKYPDPALILLGPVPAPLSKINKLYRYHIILKGRDATTLSRALHDLENLLKLPSTLNLSFDIDPLSLM